MINTNISNITPEFNNSESYLTVVMPAFNEGSNIKNNVLETSKILSTFVNNYTIIVVNDGSTDETEAQIIEASLQNDSIKYISYSPNHGKGYAIKTGVLSSNSKYTAFLDSDLELSPMMLKNFLKALIAQNADIAIGSKMHKKSQLNYPIHRRILSFGYFILLKILFHLNLKDTQTGIKLFKTETIKPIVFNLTSTGFAFDIELLASASKKGYSIIELPIKLNYSRNNGPNKSKISIKHIFDMFKETLSIRKKIKNL